MNSNTKSTEFLKYLYMCVMTSGSPVGMPDQQVPFAKAQLPSCFKVI